MGGWGGGITPTQARSVAPTSFFSFGLFLGWAGLLRWVGGGEGALLGILGVWR